jgi:putative transposase
MRFGVCVARGTLTRLDLAFQGFFRRVNAGHTPGYPRFKGAGRFDSVSYPDTSGWKLDTDTRRLYLLGVGHLKVRLHRPLNGVPKTITVRREGRRWVVVVFCAGVEPERLAATGRTVGIDLGVATLAATSDGELIPNPIPGRRLADQVAAAQRAVAAKRRGSKNRSKAVANLARLKRREANVRRDHAHQVSRRLVNTYDVICHESLRIPNMVRTAKGTVETPGRMVQAKAGLNRSIHDAGWGQLLRFIVYKAEGAGRQTIAVPAAHTSQRCASCGHTAQENRPSQAVFCCQACGHTAHADINAAINIHRAGLAQRQTPVKHEAA